MKKITGCYATIYQGNIYWNLRARGRYSREADPTTET